MSRPENQGVWCPYCCHRSIYNIPGFEDYVCYVCQHNISEEELQGLLVDQALKGKQDKIGLLEMLEDIRTNSNPDDLQELETVSECKAAIKFLHRKSIKAIQIITDEEPK